MLNNLLKRKVQTMSDRDLESGAQLAPPPLLDKRVVKTTGITDQGEVLHESFETVHELSSSSPQTKLPCLISENTTGQEPEIFCLMIMPRESID